MDVTFHSKRDLAGGTKALISGNIMLMCPKGRINETDIEVRVTRGRDCEAREAASF